MSGEEGARVQKRSSVGSVGGAAGGGAFDTLVSAGGGGPFSSFVNMVQSGPGGEEMKRTTRAASKRAAIDDASSRTSNAAAGGGAQQAKKRAALANLSNNQHHHASSLPSSRNSSPDVTAKKRAALANLSNNANVPAVRNSIAGTKGVPAGTGGGGGGAVKGKGFVAQAQPRNAVDSEATATLPSKREKVSVIVAEKGISAKTSAIPAVPSSAVAAGHVAPETQENRENVPPNRSDIDSASSSRYEGAEATVAVAKKSNAPALPAVPAVVSGPPPTADKSKQPGAHSDAALIASLEKKTLENLYISRNTKVTLGQELGWSISCQLGQDAGSSKHESFTDIDSDHTDPQMCSIYAVDIYQHLRMQEVKRRPATEFMEGLQQDINASMRGILIDWLVEVAEEYKLVPDTLYLTVSYIDRFLSKNVVNRQRLQLLGVSCMLIAAKYEEICAPQVEEFCYITDNTYAREEVLEMERRVLTNLHFELTTPTTKSFLRRFIRASQAGTLELQLEFLGNYLAELTLVEYNFLRYLPSMVAASAVFVARLTLYGDSDPWTSTLRHYTGYRASELKDCVKDVHDLQCNSKSCTLPAIREKYSQHKFKCVASLAPMSKVPAHCFEDNES